MTTINNRSRRHDAAPTGLILVYSIELLEPIPRPQVMLVRAKKGVIPSQREPVERFGFSNPWAAPTIGMNSLNRQSTLALE